MRYHEKAGRLANKIFEPNIFLHCFVEVERDASFPSIEIYFFFSRPLMGIHENNQRVPVVLAVTVGAQKDRRRETTFGLILLFIPFPFPIVGSIFGSLNDRQSQRRTECSAALSVLHVVADVVVGFCILKVGAFLLHIVLAGPSMCSTGF